MSKLSHYPLIVHLVNHILTSHSTLAWKFLRADLKTRRDVEEGVNYVEPYVFCRLEIRHLIGGHNPVRSIEMIRIDNL